MHSFRCCTGVSVIRLVASLPPPVKPLTAVCLSCIWRLSCLGCASIAAFFFSGTVAYGKSYSNPWFYVYFVFILDFLQGCSETFKAVSSLKEHLQSCAKAISYKCLACGKKYLSLLIIQKHIKHLHVGYMVIFFFNHRTVSLIKAKWWLFLITSIAAGVSLTGGNQWFTPTSKTSYRCSCSLLHFDVISYLIARPFVL